MTKRRRTPSGREIEKLWLREVGDLSSSGFAHQIGASEDLVRRLDIYRKLDRHNGCVNTVSFNAEGNILASGSDDLMILLWDWDVGNVKLEFHSGHSSNVFQAKFMPYANDQSLVTCAADGQVRHACIREGGCVDTAKLAKHDGRAHRLAVEPGSPHIFYSCGEDGLVQHFDLRTRAATQLFFCHSFRDKSTSNRRRSSQDRQQILNLNAIAIDQRNPNLFAVAGSDSYARLYDIRKYKLDGTTNSDCPASYFCPVHLIGKKRIGITGLAFSDQSELLVSYNDEQIYLFDKGMGLGIEQISATTNLAEISSEGESSLKSSPQVYQGHRNCDTVKGVNFFGPSCEYVVSGSDCGRMFIWRKKDAELLRAMEGDKHVVNCIESHPHATILASSGIESDVKMWIPMATELSALPVDVDEPKYKNRRWLSDLPSPHDVILHILPLLREGENGELGREGAVLLHYIMGLRGNDEADDGGEASDSPGDCGAI